MRIALLTAFIAIAPSVAMSAPALTIFSATGSSPAAIQSEVDAFRNALGVLNPNEPQNFDGGRRQINWDAAPGAISDPNLFPGDFFNGPAAPRARGIEFQATGTTTGFELSSDPTDNGPGQPAPPLFNLASDFQFFSPNRIFRPVDGFTFDVMFFDPFDQTGPATTRGLGVVFTDVEDPGEAVMDFFDLGGALLTSLEVPTAGDTDLSFLGVLFDDPIIGRVSITAGTDSQNVAMDDFIFGEPTPIPVPAPALLLVAGFGALATRGRLRRAA